MPTTKLIFHNIFLKKNLFFLIKQMKFSFHGLAWLVEKKDTGTWEIDVD